MSRKRVSDFGVTLSQSTLDKYHVFYSLQEYCDEIVVAQEDHTSGGRHYHCYIHTRDRQKIKELREWLADLLFFGQQAESIHIDALRNKRHWIKYCTKEDADPLYDGVDPGTFHQSYKIYEFCRSNEVFNPLAPFIRQNPGLSRIIQAAHTHYWNNIYKSRKPEIPIDFDSRAEWVRITRGGWADGRNLVIYGVAGSGKTLLLRSLEYGDQTKKTVTHLPCTDSPFEFSEIESNTQVVLAGDVGSGYMTKHRAQLLRLCDKGPVAINVKCGPIKTVYFRGQVIIVSNVNLHDECKDDQALLRRFIWVQVRNKDAIQKKVQIKTEIPEDIPEEETIVISSDSEGEGETMEM